MKQARTKKMTQAIDLPLPATRASETKLVGGVCFAHFVSHYYIMLLAPLFVFVREDYGVSYTELGLALTAFNVTLDRAADAHGLPGRPGERAPRADRRAPAHRRDRIRDRGPGEFVLGVRRHVRARGPRQHGLPPGRLRAALAATCRPSAPAACSRSTPSPACSAMRPRRRACCSCTAWWDGAAPSWAPPRSACSPPW